MATGGSATDAFSARPNYELYVAVSRNSLSGNSENLNWQVRARKTSGATSYVLDGQPWSANIEGSAYSGSHGLDFRSTDDIQIASGTTPYKAHDSAGNLTVNFSASMTASVFGTASASGSYAANRIPKVPVAPPAPVLVSRTSSQLSFTIAQPSDNGGSAVTIYNMVVYDAASGGTLVSSWSGGSSPATTPAGDLDPGTDYWVAYRAVNAIGAGPYTARVKMTTLVGVPSAPRTLVAQNPSPTTIDLDWVVPLTTGGAAITGYKVQRSLNSAFTSSVVEFLTGSTATDWVSTALAPSQPYWYRVAALNSAGQSAWSNVVTATTVSGAYYSTGTSWLSCGVFYSNGTDWLACEVYVSDGTNWIQAI